MELTFLQNRIVEATQRGYYVTEDGKLFGPKGQLKCRCYGKQAYPTFSTNWGGRVYGIPAHKLAAYCFYGKDSFEPGVVVRHLNADVLDISRRNIALGSYSDNEMDKPAQVRSRSAAAGRRSQGYRAVNRKLTEDQVDEVMKFYNNLGGRKAPQGSVKELGEKLGVSRTVLNKIKRGMYYASSTY